ncbi:MAG: restriction endonuclease subunit S [Nitriliruptor sp.]|uniref:restriction endonuclease subunit S n=1 Tax=Nitriliruptor sp. TaxID=2448056 RepID=UPI00349FFAE9
MRYGMGQPPSLAEEGGLPIIRATNIERGRITTEHLQRAHPADLPLDRAPLLQAGEILVVRSGAYTGDSALITEAWAGSAPGYDLRVTPLRGTEPRFLAWCLLSRYCLDQLDLSKMRAAQPHLNADELASVRVPLPPSSRQRGIADYLDGETARIDALLDRSAQLGRLVRERHERFVVSAVCEGVGHDARLAAAGVDWLDRVNTEFVIGPYAMFARTGSGHTPSRSVPEYWVDCDVPWVTTGDVKRVRSGYIEYVEETAERISQLGMANSAARLHPAGTVFLSRTASVGFAGIMAVPMATSQDFFTWTPDARLRSEYLLWSLRAMRYAGHFDRLMYGSTHKTVYVPDLMVLRGPVPPLDEQDQIVAAIREQRDETIALLDTLERANRLLAERRQALITAAVIGELEV